MAERPLITVTMTPAGGYRALIPPGAIIEATRQPRGCLCTLSDGGTHVLGPVKVDLMDLRDIERLQMIASTQDGRVNWIGGLTALAKAMHEQAQDDRPEPAGVRPTDAPSMPVEPFPLEVLPAPCQRLVHEGALALPCTPELIAVPMLTVLGVAIGTRRAIEIKTAWRERGRVYSAVIADSGQKKSPALALAMKPIYDVQATHKRAYDAAREVYEAAMHDYEAELDDWRKAPRGSRGARPTKPDEPIMGEIYTSDCTVEAMADILERHPRGVLFARDELTGWVLALNQYRGGKGADRQHWLQWWNGSPDKINRRGRKVPVVIEEPFVGVTGCLPPDSLPLLLDERINGEDGWLPRILFACPEPVPTPWTDAVVSPEAEAAYAAVVQRLLALTDDRTLTCTPSARVRLVEAIDELAAARQDPATPPDMIPFLAKLDGYLARLALILQMTRWAAGETAREIIEEQSVVGAAALVDYFRAQAIRVHARLQTSPEDKQVAQALAWIREHGGTTTARELLRHHVAGIKTASAAKSLLMHLEDRSWGTATEGDRHRVAFRLAE